MLLSVVSELRRYGVAYAGVYKGGIGDVIYISRPSIVARVLW